MTREGFSLRDKKNMPISQETLLGTGIILCTHKIYYILNVHVILF